MTLTRVESPVDATGGHLGFKSSESSLGRRVIILSNLSNPLRAGDWAGGTVWVLSSRLQQNQRENVQSLRVKVNWNILCPRIQKHFPESRLWDVFWILGPVLDSGKCFWILGPVLDSGNCFWIVGSVLSLWATVCLRQQGFETNRLQNLFNKFVNRHGLIVEKYGAALREMTLAIQA